MSAGVDLEREFDTAVSDVRQPHLDRLQSLGVPPAAIAAVGQRHPAFGVIQAEGEANGFYQPAGGLLHVVMPIYEGGSLIDLVAWRSGEPHRWWLRTGLGWMLNADACLCSRWDGHKLALHSTPLAWLQSASGGLLEAGGVVVDWDSPDLAWLRGFDAIDCDTQWLGATLRRALTKPLRLPAIRSTEARHAA